ncbi:hypothetical protein D3C71_2072420 [compost metagenome]
MARHPAQDPALPQGGLIQAMECAFAGLEKNLDGLRGCPDADYIEQAMCLLVFTRYVAGRDITGAFFRLTDQRQRLARELDTAALHGKRP